MANKEHLEILKQGVDVWNKWRKDNPDVVPDLSGATLIGANLSRYNLSGVNLRGANLIDADLIDADLTFADLRGAILWGCIGNNKEIITCQTEFYTVNFTKDFLNIGCKTYSYENWFGFADDEISKMGIDALEFWNKYKENIKELKIKYGF
jgi:hypothetical protein